MVRGGEVLSPKVLINQRGLGGKSEDDVLDDGRLVESLFLYASRDILRFTTLGFHELKGVRVSRQGYPPFFVLPHDIYFSRAGGPTIHFV